MGTEGFEPLFSVRNDQHDAEKRRLARVAIEELPNTGSIIIDSGSTLTRFAESVPAGCSLRVVTNSLLTAQVLADRRLIDVLITNVELDSSIITAIESTDTTVVLA